MKRFRQCSIALGVPLLAAALLCPPAEAAPPKRPAARRPATNPAPRPAGPVLRSILVQPATATLVGARAEQGLLVTGRYADGSERDLTDRAQFRIDSPRVVALRVEASRRVLRPVADGEATVTVRVPGAAPATVRVRVRNAGEERLVSFRDEVIPALTKAGCSMGTCHGTPTGKGGFRLSLQGYAPEMDYQTLVHEGGARRVNRADPGRSLLLLKPLAELPHGGGKRLRPDMPEYQILVRWIAQGMPDDPPGHPKLEKVEVLPGRRQLRFPQDRQRVLAMARFSDGSVRDVTSLAKLSTSNEDLATISREGLVEPVENGPGRGDVAVIVRYQDALEAVPLTYVKEVPGFRWTNPPAHNYIDRLVYERLKQFRIPISGLSSDTEFIRRAYLDTIGLLPTPEEVRAFLKDSSPDKRARLIDALLQRPEFADHWAVKWADVLRVQDEKLKEEGAKAYHRWIRDSLAANKPMDQFVRELLTATGPTFHNPPANYFRVLREPAELSEATAQLFLGVRMTCAKCHNHPFERWTQDEYYQLAAFFAQVKQTSGSEKEEETIQLDPNGKVIHLRTGAVMTPKLLGADFVQAQPGQDLRAALAEWMTRKDNPFFAKALVNRIWSHLLGRGIVEPIDDFRASNPPVNEALLEALAKDFAEHGFDLRHIVRTIMNSRTYQLTARTLPLNRDDHTYFSHSEARLLSAEQLADAIAQFTGVPDEYEGYPLGTRAMQLAGTKARTPFLKVFGRPDRNLNCECEREKEPTLFQALALISGRPVHNKLASDQGRIAKLAASSRSDAEVIEELYLAALARRPTAKEQRQWLDYLRSSGNRRQALEDLGWVLINSKEFLFRH